MPPPVEVRTRTHSQQRTGSAQKCGKTRSETAITFFMTVSSAPRHALAALASAVLLICNAAVCAQAEGPRLLPGAGVPPSECTFTSRGRTELEPRFETFGTWNLTSLQFTVNKKPCWAASGIKQGAALQCLRGKHIAFVGDSTTRYQYISLLNFLHTGKWLKEWDNWFGRNPLHEATWPDWRTFSIESCSMFAPYERCDVFRKAALGANWKPSMTENRYYYHPEHDINITFIGYFERAQGHLPLGFYPAPPLTVKNYHQTPFDFVGDLPLVALMLKAEFGGVDFMLVNSGVWRVPALHDSGPEVVSLLKTLEKGMRDPATKPVWSTTSSAGPTWPVRELAVEAASLGWPVFDRFAITDSAERALVAAGRTIAEAHEHENHVRSWVNTVINEALLGMICSRN